MNNNAPEKIYLFENPISDTPDDRWLSKRSDKKDIEYTRTDAFIDKATKWLEDNAIEYWGTEAVDNGMMIDDFKKAMKL